jgi:acyl-coenzyme A thioesterase PaaI-like protein
MVDCSPAIKPLTEEVIRSPHKDCFACGDSESGLKLSFRCCDDGSITTEWICPELYQSYEGMVHGGIVATLLDAAMTNCLFAQGIEAVTGNLNLRYRIPLRLSEKIVVNAKLVEQRSDIYILESQVLQNDKIAASASARFVRRKP